MDLFKLLGTISIKNSDANKALDETSKKGESAKNKLSKALTSVGKGAVVVGKTVATGLAVGGAAMGTLTIKALNLSGELEQNMGGSEAVFGKYASKMQDTAKQAFSEMGLSTSDYLATANKMGALFQGAGFSIEESMSLSSDAMQRAADVASIMGIDTSAAMEAVAGAAKGNFTMMDNLGVAMNDTTIQAYALSKGIDKSTSEMTNQEKIGLAMEMFMEKTAYAAGNYAKENETLAGSLGTAKAALTNFLDGSGDVNQLVDAFSNAANVIVDNVAEIAPRLMTGITQVVNKIIPMLPPLLQEMLPAIIAGAVNLINGLISQLPSLLNMLTTSVIPSLLSGFTTIVFALIKALPQFIESICAALPTLIPPLIDGLVGMIVMLCRYIPQMIQPIIDNLPLIIVSICDALLTNLPDLIWGVGQLIIGLAKAIPKLWGALRDAVKGIFTSLLSHFAKWFEPITNWFKNAWNKCTDIVSEAWQAIKKAVKDAIEKVKTTVSTVFNSIKSKASSIWNGIKSSISNTVNSVKSNVTNAFNNVKSKISSTFNSIKSTATSVWNKIKSAITTPIESAKNKIKSIVDTIKGFFSGLNISFPHIKLPHFSISPSGWSIGDLLEGSIPSLSIEWYARAMRNPMLMNSPTIFGYNPETGAAMGGGEAGSEVVSGTNTLMNMIGRAVALNSNAQSERIVQLLTALLEATVGGNKEMLSALLAGQKIEINGREFGRAVREYA